MCINCGTPTDGTLRCSVCNDKLKRYIDIKIEQGLCSICFKPRESHSRFCDHHYDLNMQYRKKYNFERSNIC